MEMEGEKFMAKVITLTEEQAATLTTYILITTRYREREIEASARLGLETNDDGVIKYPNMLANAEWWRITHRELAGIVAQVDNAPDLEIAKKHRQRADR